MDQYFLTKHVFFCDGDAIVFLDLKNDEYSLIQGEQARVFHSLWRSPSDGDSPPPPAPHADASSILKELCNAGVLTTDRAHGKPILPTAAEAPREHLVDDEHDRLVRVRVIDVWRFFSSCATAALWLRVRSIESTVNAVQLRKSLRGRRHPIDWDKARRLVATFNRLRSLFPARYLCLFDSLALIHFLARYDIYPTWVFAVLPHPWEAHCWVQEGPIVFNEDVEQAAAFVPIMTV